MPRMLLMRFNPRPPLLAGESQVLRHAAPKTFVSIHARHCWRANHHAKALALVQIVVSIHARHCWRANRHSGYGWLIFHLVSIHARHCWRANPFRAKPLSENKNSRQLREPVQVNDSYQQSEERKFHNNHLNQ